MLFLSDRMTSASGSIGGTTFSHNRYGMYTRARRVPVNPNTSLQVAARQALADATQAWRDVLTAGQRAAWESYALASPVTNRLGQAITLTGQAAYVANNVIHLLFELSRLDNAPATPGYGSVGPSPPLNVAISVGGGTLTIANYLATLNNGYLGYQVGPAISAGRSFFAGPYQLKDYLQATVDPLSFVTAGGYNAAPYVLGDRIPVRVIGLTTNGRLILPYTQIVTVGA